MQKVITINLNGNAYQLDETGYEALRAYLDQAGARLAGNPDGRDRARSRTVDRGQMRPVSRSGKDRGLGA